jgi:hypothetical protein
LLFRPNMSWRDISSEERQPSIAITMRERRQKQNE